jgi:hypothetical protein
MYALLASHRCAMFDLAVYDLHCSKDITSGAQASGSTLPFTEALFKAGVSETPHSTKQVSLTVHSRYCSRNS